MEKKKIFSVVLAAFIFLLGAPVVTAKAEETALSQIDSSTQASADLYVSNNYEQIIYVAQEFADCFESSKEGWNNLTIGKSYVVDTPDDDSQDEIYYYPLINGDNIVLVICVYQSTDEWTFSLSTDMVFRLNYIDFENNPECYTLYYNDNAELLVEGPDGLVAFPEENRVSVPTEVMSDDKAKASSKSSRIATEDVYNYKPKYSINEATYKECKLCNPQGQGAFARCWAATCATMLNYEWGLNLSAAGICDLQNIGYNERASIIKMQEVLEDFGLERNLYGMLAWGDIVEEINNKRLIGVAALTKSEKDGHAVTVFGYRRIANYCYVILWNSALNNNAGGSQVVLYDEDETRFVSGGMEFIWKNSLAQ